MCCWTLWIMNVCLACQRAIKDGFSIKQQQQQQQKQLNITQAIYNAFLCSSTFLWKLSAILCNKKFSFFILSCCCVFFFVPLACDVNSYLRFYLYRDYLCLLPYLPPRIVFFGFCLWCLIDISHIFLLLLCCPWPEQQQQLPLTLIMAFEWIKSPIDGEMI